MDEKKRYVTIKDIANELGISKSTVSRALNEDAKNVSGETMRKIKEAALRMGYRRNEMAVNLRAQSNHVIGISLPEMSTAFNVRFVSDAQNMLMHEGYRVSIAFSDESPEIERANLEMFNRLRVDGVLVSPCHNVANLDIYKKFIDQRVPLVFFDRIIPELDVPMVRSNDYIKSFFMVEHLIYNGYRKILHLAGPEYIHNSIDRFKGWRDAIKKFNIEYDPAYSIKCGMTVNDGAKGIEEAMGKNLEFDSVFCFTETQAVGAKQQLQKLGKRIPEDVAICTMSGTRLSTFVYPQLTASEQQVAKMAKAAVDMLLEKIKDYDTPSRSVTIDGQIVKRASTRNDK